MADEPIPGGLTPDELKQFIEWNRGCAHDPDEVRRAWTHYVRRWRAGHGAMPPASPPRAPRTHNDRYEELD